MNNIIALNLTKNTTVNTTQDECMSSTFMDVIDVQSATVDKPTNGNFIDVIDSHSDKFTFRENGMLTVGNGDTLMYDFSINWKDGSYILNITTDDYDIEEVANAHKKFIGYPDVKTVGYGLIDPKGREYHIEYTVNDNEIVFTGFVLPEMCEQWNTEFDLPVDTVNDLEFNIAFFSINLTLFQMFDAYFKSDDASIEE